MDDAMESAMDDAMLSPIADAMVLSMVGSMNPVSYTHLTLPTTPYV